MSLMLHAGAEVVTLDFLHQIPTPEATRTHIGIKSHRNCPKAVSSVMAARLTVFTGNKASRSA